MEIMKSLGNPLEAYPIPFRRIHSSTQFKQSNERISTQTLICFANGSPPSNEVGERAEWYGEQMSRQGCVEPELTSIQTVIFVDMMNARMPKGTHLCEKSLLGMAVRHWSNSVAGTFDISWQRYVPY